VSAEQDAVDGLTRVLVRACRQLADAGQPRAAGRLAEVGEVPHGIDAAGLADWCDGLIGDIEAGAEVAAQRLAPRLTVPSG